MQKQELLNALAVIQNDDAIIKGEFIFDRKYSTQYSCNITSITMSYTEADGWEAIISLQEEPDSNDAVKDDPPVKTMTKAKLVDALNMLTEENPKLSANFEYFNHYGSSYAADIFGVKLVFDSIGTQAIIEVKEVVKESEEVAA